MKNTDYKKKEVSTVLQLVGQLKSSYLLGTLSERFKTLNENQQEKNFTEFIPLRAPEGIGLLHKVEKNPCKLK